MRNSGTSPRPTRSFLIKKSDPSTTATDSMAPSCQDPRAPPPPGSTTTMPTICSAASSVPTTGSKKTPLIAVSSMPISRPQQAGAEEAATLITNIRPHRAGRPPQHTPAISRSRASPRLTPIPQSPQITSRPTRNIPTPRPITQPRGAAHRARRAAPPSQQKMSSCQQKARP